MALKSVLSLYLSGAGEAKPLLCTRDCFHLWHLFSLFVYYLIVERSILIMRTLTSWSWARASLSSSFLRVLALSLPLLCLRALAQTSEVVSLPAP